MVLSCLQRGALRRSGCGEWRRAGRWIPTDQRWRLVSASVVVAGVVAVVSIIALMTGDRGLDAIYPGGEGRYDRIRPLTDIGAVAARFGEMVPPAPARYNIAPDPPDGVVDISDIAAVASYFGQSCT